VPDVVTDDDLISLRILRFAGADAGTSEGSEAITQDQLDLILGEVIRRGESGELDGILLRDPEADLTAVAQSVATQALLGHPGGLKARHCKVAEIVIIHTRDFVLAHPFLDDGGRYWT
jgi:hypothetical protein